MPHHICICMQNEILCIPIETLKFNFDQKPIKLKQIPILTISLEQVVALTFAFELKCPVAGEWRLRAKKFNCSSSQYVCLLHIRYRLEDIYKESCDGLDYSSIGVWYGVFGRSKVDIAVFTSSGDGIINGDVCGGVQSNSESSKSNPSSKSTDIACLFGWLVADSTGDACLPGVEWTDDNVRLDDDALGFTLAVNLYLNRFSTKHNAPLKDINLFHSQPMAVVIVCITSHFVTKKANLFLIKEVLTMTTCGCNSSKGYRFVIKPRNNCFCIPSEEDCICYKVTCNEGDNQCRQDGSVLMNASCLEITTKGFSESNKSAPSVRDRINVTQYIIDYANKGISYQQYCAYATVTLLIIIIITVPIYEIHIQNTKSLDVTNRNEHLAAIKDGTEIRRYVRIQVIGKDGVGKSSLVRRLVGDDDTKLKSTDGIDIVKKCQIRTTDGKWVIGEGIHSLVDDIENKKYNKSTKYWLPESNKSAPSVRDRITVTQYIIDYANKGRSYQHYCAYATVTLLIIMIITVPIYALVEIHIQNTKILDVIGKDGVGKSSLVRRLVGDDNTKLKSTDGIDIVKKCQIRTTDGKWVIGEVKIERTKIIKRIQEAVYKEQQQSLSVSDQSIPCGGENNEKEAIVSNEPLSEVERKQENDPPTKDKIRIASRGSNAVDKSLKGENKVNMGDNVTIVVEKSEIDIPKEYDGVLSKDIKKPKIW
ncbi:unnamed protein product [Mytilus coruscus]|uniref:Uncharacterized protein n=1 Tax=Mytilus coruscus TaxID=42192 RepID=A0A6J8EYE7_MYTCO|nr:unnamed protein product [Mytilus coruscus]